MKKYILTFILFSIIHFVYSQDSEMIIHEGEYNDLNLLRSFKLNAAPLLNPDLLQTSDIIYTFDFKEVEENLEYTFAADEDFIDSLGFSEEMKSALIISSGESYNTMAELIDEFTRILGEDRFNASSDQIYNKIQFTDENLNVMVQKGELGIASRDNAGAYTVLNNDKLNAILAESAAGENELFFVNKSQSLENITAQEAIITWDIQDSVMNSSSE